MEKLTLNKEVIPTIESREVAQMMELRHSDLMRKIEGINKDFENAKMRSQNYWIESTYKTEGNNKSYKCYEITKRGCEFLAHKSTGTKGNLFTARYMDKFEEMEQVLKSNVPQLTRKEQLQLQILNGNDIDRMVGLKEYETEIEKPLLETIDNKDAVIHTILPSKKLYGVSEVGRVLKGYNPEVMGEKKIYRYLHNERILINNPGKQRHNAPYDKYSKHFKLKPYSVENLGCPIYKAYFTGDGLNWFLNKLAKEGILKKEAIEDIESKLS